MNRGYAGNDSPKPAVPPTPQWRLENAVQRRRRRSQKLGGDVLRPEARPVRPAAVAGVHENAAPTVSYDMALAPGRRQTATGSGAPPAATRGWVASDRWTWWMPPYGGAFYFPKFHPFGVVSGGQAPSLVTPTPGPKRMCGPHAAPATSGKIWAFDPSFGSVNGLTYPRCFRHPEKPEGHVMVPGFCTAARGVWALLPVHRRGHDARDDRTRQLASR